jgi:hypothetical protein
MTFRTISYKEFLRLQLGDTVYVNKEDFYIDDDGPDLDEWTALEFQGRQDAYYDNAKSRQYCLTGTAWREHLTLHWRCLHLPTYERSEIQDQIGYDS